MESGKLRHRVTLQKIDSSATADAAGHIDESADATWVTHFTCWAQVIPKGAREFFGGQQVQADVTHQVVVRSCTETRAITAAMRMRYAGATYNLSGPPFDPTGRREAIVFNVIQVA